MGQVPGAARSAVVRAADVLAAIAAVTTRGAARDRHPHRAAAARGVARQAGRDARRDVAAAGSTSASAPGGSARSTTREGLDFDAARPAAQRHARRVQGAVARHAGRDRHADALVPRHLLRAEAAAARRRAAVDRGRAARAQPRPDRAAAATRGSRSWARRSTTSPTARAASRTRGRRRAATRRLQVQAPLRIERGDDGRPDLARSMASVPELVAAGATDVHVTLRAFSRDPAEAPAVFAEIVAASPTRSLQASAVRFALVLTPFDDYPIHQTPLPIAHPATGDPNHYDRFWFNGYTEDFYFAVRHGRVPEPRHHRRRVRGRARRRAAFGVRVGSHPRGSQRDAHRSADDRNRRTAARRHVCAPTPPISASTPTSRSPARTVALEEPRQTITVGHEDVMDSTRLTQWGTWSGRIVVGRRSRSRSTGCTAPRTGRGACAGRRARAAPRPRSRCRRSSSCGRRSTGTTAARTSSASTRQRRSVRRQPGGARLIGDGDPTWANATTKRIEHLAGTVAHVRWAPGLRRSQGASLRLLRHDGARGAHRARTAAHVPHARPRLHASRVGPRSLARRARGRFRGAQGRGARQPRAVEHPHPAGDARPLGRPGRARCARAARVRRAPTRAASPASSTATAVESRPCHCRSVHARRGQNNNQMDQLCTSSVSSLTNRSRQLA